MRDRAIAITGAAGDIGQAAARRFHAAGSRVALLDVAEEPLAKVASTLGGSKAIVADITSDLAMRDAAAAAHAAFGPLHAVFLNAGIEQPHLPLTELSEAVIGRVLSVNLAGALLAAKHFVPLMADGGSIIITSSIAGLMGIPNYSVYSATKAGLVGLMRSLAIDVAPRRIRCNCIHPGTVRSRMIERTAQAASPGGDTSEWYKGAAAMIRLGRLIEPDEIADLVMFLAGDHSRMITGQSIAIDGGMLL